MPQTKNPDSLFAQYPKPQLQDCSFYHSFDTADGEIIGQWDLRKNAAQYLGGVDLTNRSVLEVGPASGFLSYYMESRGANVTCVEPPLAYLWDTVPFENYDFATWRREFTEEIKRVRNSFWYVHHEKNSRVRLMETDPCNIPAAAGQFDIGLLASVLLHCRRPFDLLESVAKRTEHAMVITEIWNPTLGDGPVCMLLPHQGMRQVHTWWHFTPQFFISALGILGFTKPRVSIHTQQQPAENREVTLFTVVCERP
ncbi:bifunctional 2-polyprenyl-6-hydroxyphenol methylase/3-demethylubiquinol 3-O-methyltransferase UbiG [Azospira sp. I13]|uniref:class I SAM-dependent methyltransferase n=1 Tax=Azospira sp. I13 TaxID=1765050 RepID=UPI00191307C3|nr:hypothetical protein [Azospira sp. I13]